MGIAVSDFAYASNTKETGFFPFSTAVRRLLSKNPVSGHPRII
jgi:hypothetical protein